MLPVLGDGMARPIMLLLSILLHVLADFFFFISFVHLTLTATLISPNFYISEKRKEKSAFETNIFPAKR